MLVITIFEKRGSKRDKAQYDIVGVRQNCKYLDKLS